MKINCKENRHVKVLDDIFDDMKHILLESTAEFKHTNNNRFKVIPGWNDEIKQLYTVARDSFLSWKRHGRPLNGALCDQMKATRSLFKRALKNVRKMKT